MHERESPCGGGSIIHGEESQAKRGKIPSGRGWQLAPETSPTLMTCSHSQRGRVVHLTTANARVCSGGAGDPASEARGASTPATVIEGNKPRVVASRPCFPRGVRRVDSAQHKRRDYGAWGRVPPSCGR